MLNNRLKIKDLRGKASLFLLLLGSLLARPCFAGLLPPIILVPPLSQTVHYYDSVTFSVVATSDSTMTYQWFKDGAIIGGATLSTYSIANAQYSDQGGYSVQVVNSIGSATSSEATLTVISPPSIITQPQNKIVAAGQNASFSVVANGTATLSYQWRFNGTNLSGATSSALTVANAQTNNAGAYKVAVSNPYGSVTSSVAALTVLFPPTITNQPASQTATVGQSRSFSVGVSGTAPLRYQWRINGTALTGATNATLTLGNVQTTNGGSYTAVVTNLVGSVTSAVATLTVYAPPAITMQPMSQTLTQGQNASLFVAASGSAPLSYQWQFSGTNLAGATDATLVLTNVQLVQAGKYVAIVTNPWGAAVSAPASLTVVLPPGMDRPTMQGLVVHLTFDADLTDSSGRGNHAAAVGAPNLVPGFIGAQAFNPFNQNGTNNYATLGTPSDLNFGTNSDFSIAFWARLPAGAWGGSSYYEPPFICNKNFSTYANVGWALTTSAAGILEWNYSEGSAVNYFGPGGTFGNRIWHHIAVTFQRGGNGIAYVDGAPVSTNSIAPGGKTIDSGLPTNIGNDGTGSYPNYYGYFTNAFGLPANGLAMDDLGIWRRALLPAEIGGIYNAGLAGQDLSTVTSSNLTTTVLLRIAQQPVSLTAFGGSQATFSVAASGAGPLSFQWYSNGAPILGANGALLTLSNVQPAQAGSYWVAVSDSNTSLTSSVATLTVVFPPAITTPPASQTVVAGQSASFSVVAGGTAPLWYQWCRNGTAVAGATDVSLTFANLQTNNAGNYTVVVTNAWGSVTSAVATLTVLVPAGITTQPQSLAVLAGQSATFSVTANGTAPFSYQWSFNGATLAGATKSALTFSSVQTNRAGSYMVTVANSAGSVTSAVATLAVYVPAAVYTDPQQQTVVQGQSASFSVVASGTAPFNYQWRFNGSSLPGATNSTLVIANAQTTNAGTYKVTVWNSWGFDTSHPADLTVNTPPSITTQPQGQAVTAGQSVSFSVVAGGIPAVSYQWSLEGAVLPGATNSTLALTNVQASNAGNYSVVVTNSVGSVTSSVAALTVSAPPTLDSAGMAATGFTFQLSVPVGSTCVILASTDLQNWTPIATNVATTATMIFTDTDATNYSARFYKALVR